MKLEISPTAGKEKLQRPNALAPIEPALDRLLPLLPAAQLAQIPICAGVPERAENASDETTLDLKDEKPRVFSRLFHRVLEISKKEV